jgi:hypothetical protein
MCGKQRLLREKMIQEQEEKRLLEQFDDYCTKKSLTLPLTVHDKKKLIQMILMLEKLQKGNPQRYEITLQKMGLNKILDQNSSETSIFDAIIAFYGATKTNTPQKTMTATRPQEQSAAVKQVADEISRDIFEDIKSNAWDAINQRFTHNSRGDR